MEVKGKIIFVSPRKDGTSQRTGKTYALQEFVIESPSFEGRTKKMMFSVFGEERLNNMHLAVGDEGTLSFDIDARAHNGRWYNDITAWRFVRTGDEQKSTSTQTAAQNTANDNDNKNLPF